MFEDDDYTMRVRAAGLKVVCARDAFVHHFGQAAFGKLIKSGEYEALFEENRRRFESKWKIKWIPHTHGPLEAKAQDLAAATSIEPEADEAIKQNGFLRLPEFNLFQALKPGAGYFYRAELLGDNFHIEG